MGRLLFQIDSEAYCQLDLFNMIVDVEGFVDVDGDVPAFLVDHEHEFLFFKRSAKDVVVQTFWRAEQGWLMTTSVAIAQSIDWLA